MQNPSFEDTVACPPGFSTSTVDFITDAQGWRTACNSSDYYNGYSSWWMNSVPNNIAGHYPAATGQAYCGMFVAWDNGIDDYHEMIGSQLSAPLIVGTKYYVSFKTICSGQTGSLWRKACNKMGILFSTVAHTNTNPIGLINFSHIYTDSVITDTVNWTLVQGSFIADSAYNYIMVGSFFDRFHRNIINLTPSPAAGVYYFFDDICVAKDSSMCYSLTGIDEHSGEKEKLILSNPFGDNLQVKVKGKERTEIILYDILLRKLLQQTFINSTIVSTEQLKKGIYIYVLTNKNGKVATGKIVKE